MWDASSGRLVKTIRAHNADISSVVFSPRGTQIISASEDRTLRVWDKQTGELVSTLSGHGNSVLCIAVSPDGRLVASGGNRTIRIWKLK